MSFDSHRCFDFTLVQPGCQVFINSSVVKFIQTMDTKVQVAEPAPPKLFASFITGFNTVANHIELILFPLILDLLLWFGPHLGLKSVLDPFVQRLIGLPELNTPDMASVLTTLQSFWTFVVERFNLASLLRTYPVGVPSLMSGQAPIQTPLGTAPIFQINSPLSAFGGFVIISLLGLVVGTWYFHKVSQVVFPKEENTGILALSWNTLQIILLTFTLFLLLLVLLIPSMIVLPLLMVINPSFAQITMVLFIIVLIWLVIPFLFSPHGIFVFHQNALTSILTSARVIRFSMPGSMIFFFVILIISQGMDILWLVPPDSSWMALVGIAGHAFIATGLLAASFVYYGAAIKWLQEIVQQNNKSQKVNI